MWTFSSEPMMANIILMVPEPVLSARTGVECAVSAREENVV
jgi:hypothetical protein